MPDDDSVGRSSNMRFVRRIAAGRRIGVAEVQQVEAATSGVRAVDYLDGGGGGADLEVRELLGVCGYLLTHGTRGELRHRVLTAVADVYNLAGWIRFDQGGTNSALRHLNRARELAESADDPGLVANIDYRIGRVHLHSGSQEQALDSFSRGRSALEAGRHHHAHSILRINQAWAWAGMGDIDSARTGLAEAEDLFDMADFADVPVWSRFFDQTDLAAMTGVIYTELALTADRRYTAFAIPALEDACSNYPATMRRSHVFALITSAVSHLIEGDISTGLDRGTAALDLAVHVASNRIKDRIHPLHTTLTGLPTARRSDAVRELISRINAQLSRQTGSRPTADHPAPVDPPHA